MFPESAESIGRQFCVAYCMRDGPVAEIVLDRTRIMAIVRKFIATRVAQHVGMDGEGELRVSPGSSSHLADGRQRSLAFAHEYEPRFRVAFS